MVAKQSTKCLIGFRALTSTRSTNHMAMISKSSESYSSLVSCPLPFSALLSDPLPTVCEFQPGRLDTRSLSLKCYTLCRGRKRFSILFCIVYAASCLTKLSPSLSILMFGRLLGGIATSLLFSVFEAWMVSEHFSRGTVALWEISNKFICLQSMSANRLQRASLVRHVHMGDILERIGCNFFG